MTEVVRNPLIDEILDANRAVARGQDKAYEGYRSHCHRVLNFARAVATTPLTAQDEDKLAVAAAFHDLFVFDGLDYLEPSMQAASAYLRETGREDWDREVALTIAFHHRVRPYRGEAEHLVEPFRKADWNDFTMGLVRQGVPRDVRKACDREFPVREFIPKTVTRFALGWLPRHLGDPLPPFRGGRALRRTGR